MRQWIRPSFRLQFSLCMAVFLLNILLAQLFQNGFFHNLSWVIYGGLFLLNPVWPERWSTPQPEARERGIRIAGAICILIGLITRFGV